MANRKNTRKFNWGKIVHSGMGGFLNPPNHPEHNYSVRSVYGDTFSICLSSAVKETWLNDEVRFEAKKLLQNWKKNRPDIKSEEVQEWIFQVLGYFRGCYQGDNGEWDCGKINIDKSRDPWLWQDEHCGVHFIRKFYTEFEAKPAHFLLAYWGQKPVKNKEENAA